ncbi:MAG TPA: hypothetical protein VFY05_02910, partial [Candidatus Angelobacter sp.]|nr:hypothetical protein [Candidatus Angelobacter sp.]
DSMADPKRQARSEDIEQQLNAAIWDAIRYLDSPTGYREYLPGAAVPAPAKTELVILDPRPRSNWKAVLPLFLIAALIFAILLFVLLM